MAPNFSAYPFERLRKLTRREAQRESTLARWLGARGTGEQLAKLVAGRSRAAEPVRVEVVAPSTAFDRFAARCEVRVGGASIDVRGSSEAVRAIAQRLLGGPDELAAPRPLTIVERSIWSLVVATALEDLGVAGDVWPVLVDDESISSESAKTRVGRPSKSAKASKADKRAEDKRADDKRADDKRADDDLVLELAARIGDLSLAVQLRLPADLSLRAPPVRPWPDWFTDAAFDIPVIVGRCALDRRSVERLALRSVVTLDRPAGGQAELDVLGGSVGLQVANAGLEGKVATGYVPRDMSLPDDAHVELTVALGTTKLSLREIGDLAIGQIVQLGRPLAGPFELRAAGRVVGRGELVDVDGELAVRIVSLGT